MGNLTVVQPALGYDTDVDVCRLNNTIGGAVALAIGDVQVLDQVTGSVDATSGLFSRVRTVAVAGGAPAIIDASSATALVALEAVPIGGQGQFSQAGIHNVKVIAAGAVAVGARLVMSPTALGLVPSAGDVITGALKVVGILMQGISGAGTFVRTVDFSGRNGHGHAGT